MSFRPLVLAPPGGKRTPPRSPQRAAPASPTKRQRFLQMTDDNTGEMSIEEHIYRSDDYRSSSTKPAYPLPMLLQPGGRELGQRIAPDSRLRDQLNQQLAQHSISAYSTIFYHQSKPDYVGGSKPVPVLHVCIDGAQQATLKDWSPARRAIRVLLDEHGLDGTEIELYDPKRCYIPTLYAISPDDEHISIYEACRRQIIEYVDRQLGSSWRSMSLYKVKHNPSMITAVYEVVVVVDPWTSKDWGTLYANMRSLLNPASGSQTEEIGVQFIPGYCHQSLPKQSSPNPQEVETGGRSFRTTLGQFPQMGSSIGVNGELGGGTLGGYMSLTRGDKVFRGFLTNSHVIAPAERAGTELTRRFEVHGVTLQDGVEDKIRSKVHWMAIKDIYATRKDIVDERTYHQRSLADAIAKKEENEEIGRKVIVETNTINNSRRELHLLDKVSPICDRMPEPMGSVLFATGRALSPSTHILDTAFVCIPSSDKYKYDACGTDNHLPSNNSSSLAGKLPNDYGSTQRYNNPPQVIGFGPLIKGNWYFKRGRTTDLTAGICHGTEAYISLGGDRRKYNNSWEKGRYEAVGYTEETIILSAGLEVSPGREDLKNFSEPGDSGSLIIDHHGQVVGQLFGVVHGCCEPPDQSTAGTVPDLSAKTANKGVYYASRTGLVTPIDRILEAVKKMTIPRDASGRQIGEGAVLKMLP